MKLGLQLGYWGAQPEDDIAISQHAEALDFECVQIAEALVNRGLIKAIEAH